MKVSLATVIGVWIVTGTLLGGGDLLAERDFMAWSTKEVEKMLTDSPWSHGLSVMTADESLAGRVGGLQGGLIGGKGGAGRAGGGGGVGGDGAGNLGGGSFMASPHRTELVVRWTSALPVKRALARSRSSGADDTLPADEQQLLDQEETFYRVAVVGLPPELTMGVGSLSELRAATVLRRKKGPSIEVVDIVLEYQRDHLTIEFHFPKTAQITLDDKEVEFITMLGDNEVKKKFKLKDMVIGEGLAL